MGETKALDPESIQICSKCGDKFTLKNGVQHGALFFCGYCEAVILGEPDKQWLPSLGRGERIPKGFSRV